jgi:hypothetical protein
MVSKSERRGGVKNYTKYQFPLARCLKFKDCASICWHLVVGILAGFSAWKIGFGGLRLGKQLQQKQEGVGNSGVLTSYEDAEKCC